MWCGAGQQANIMRRLSQLVAYVEQLYKLFPTLMVKETLEYEQRVQVCDHRRDGIRHEVLRIQDRGGRAASSGAKVFEVFDEVTILNEGEMMCHGPRKVRFEYLGFKRPPERDVAEYLLEPTILKYKYGLSEMAHHPLVLPVPSW
ncbi:hypothetical protein F443_17952 [Phytophthora nicotianae P1569]|uniref:Uncharacterized protein n=1 Tax=Phytophthora nicotianae P1569 TaxID=1317065 RepID=V9EBW7_PHYNI|nr:hypothetical protein F443_17952 [Phytophthora nicotianae P1569]